MWSETIYLVYITGDLYINPSMIESINVCANGNGCLIVMATGKVHAVNMSSNDVVKRINKSMNSGD